jgi:uncharacterized protein YeeX (DUF496 family)
VQKLEEMVQDQEKLRSHQSDLEQKLSQIQQRFDTAKVRIKYVKKGMTFDEVAGILGDIQVDRKATSCDYLDFCTTDYGSYVIHWKESRRSFVVMAIKRN